MNIIKASRELTAVEKYLMTADQGIISLKDVEDNTHLTVSAYVFYEKEDHNGYSTELLSIMTPSGEVYCCQSATFKKSFEEIAELYPNSEFTVIKISGKTKSNRDYINCRLKLN